MDRAVCPGGRVSRDGRLPAGDPGPRRTEAAAMTTTAATCTQPGCGGTIDGVYCTLSGMAPAPPTAPAVAGAPATCTQPGCGGTIDGGYCTVCGMAAASVPAPVPVTVSQGLGSLPFTSGTGGPAGSRGRPGPHSHRG